MEQIFTAYPKFLDYGLFVGFSVGLHIATGFLIRKLLNNNTELSKTNQDLALKFIQALSDLKEAINNATRNR